MMRKRHMDAEIERALRLGTQGAADRKAEVWRAVARGVAKIDDERNHADMRKKRNQLLALTGVAAAAAVAIVVYSTTPEGTALAGRLVKFFAPEKTIDTQIEGTTETPNAQLSQNTDNEIGYVLYYDAERYAKESSGGIDYYKALNQPEGYPPVQMEISQLKDTDAAVKYQQILTAADKDFDHAEGGPVEEPVKGWRILAWNETGSDAPYEQTYVVDNRAGGCFVIRVRLFVEAEEGHGARMLAMLKTFEIVRSSSIPEATPTPAVKAGKLTWETLAVNGAVLGTAEDKALEALTAAFGNPESDEKADDSGGKTRTLRWSDGTTAAIRNGKLYSIEATNPAAVMPNGLHAGLTLTEFTQALGAEPHEAINSALAWGVGSNDNLIVAVKDGVVVSMKISLIE